MENVQILDELLELSKKKSNRLNIDESNKAEEVLLIYINSKENTHKNKYIMGFNSEIGIKVFIKCLEKNSQENQLLEIKNLLSDDEFNENNSNNSARRGMDLVVELYNNNFSYELYSKAFLETINVIMNTTKSGVNKTIIRIMKDNFYNKIKDEFFESCPIEFIEDEAFNNMEALLINSTFNDELAETLVSYKKKVKVLKYLSKYKKKSTLVKRDKKLLENSLLKLKKEFIDQLLKDESVMEMYGEYIRKASNQERNENEYIKVKDPVKTKENDEKSVIKNIKSEAITKYKIELDLQTIISGLSRLEKQNKDIFLRLDNYRKQIEREKYKNEILDEKLKNSNEVLKERESQIMDLNKQIDELKMKINHQEEEIKTSENQIKEIAFTNVNLDNNSLKQFKNKLSNAIKRDFNDLKDIGNVEANSNSLKFIENKILSITKTLINNDINL